MRMDKKSLFWWYGHKLVETCRKQRIQVCRVTKWNPKRKSDKKSLWVRNRPLSCVHNT